MVAGVFTGTVTAYYIADYLSGALGIDPELAGFAVGLLFKEIVERVLDGRIPFLQHYIGVGKDHPKGR